MFQLLSGGALGLGLAVLPNQIMSDLAYLECSDAGNPDTSSPRTPVQESSELM